MNVFKTSTSDESPLDGSTPSTQGARTVSDFLTIQAFTNFAAMTGAIGAAWKAIQRATDKGPDELRLVPYAFAAAFAIVSLLMSLEGLKKQGKYDVGTLAGAVFVGVVNALVLAGAVIGTDTVTTGTPRP